MTNDNALSQQNYTADKEHLDIICECFSTTAPKIKNIAPLKSGMTNSSFIFEFENQKYIFRIPGAGTEELINRKEEYEVYKKIVPYKICDDLIYFNAENGYKITKFVDNARVCNPENEKDVKKCMKTLRDFHNLAIKVNHRFDLFWQIDYYEKLKSEVSLYSDYAEVKRKVYSLKEFVDTCDKSERLSHIDAVSDNFLLTDERVYLIDWEYSAMQDPHIDIAMFAIYAFYSKEQVDRLIDIYFENKCDIKTRLKIYCYIAACGLLWSNWSEFKLELGVDFGDYALKQYTYAKEYYKYFEESKKQL